MPRQLPWLNSGSRTKTEVKLSSKAAGKDPIREDGFDDDFFKGTVLESSRKGKGRADPLESDDGLSESSAQSKCKAKERLDRAPSSSPPAPEMDLPPPQIEFMHKGVDKFHLHDDEWMMVEDEFMETAKLFTKHLHLAQYETMREEIAKKKSILRPVVSSETPSAETSFNLKAKAQAKAQSKAIKDVSKNDFAAKPRTSSAKGVSSSSSERTILETTTISRPAKAPIIRSPTKVAAKKLQDGSDIKGLDALSKRPFQPSLSRTSITSHTFAKPAIPSKTGTSMASKSASSTLSTPSTTHPRPMRATHSDLFDDSPPIKPSPTSTVQTSTRLGTKFSQQNRPKRSLDLLDHYDPFTSRRDSLPKEQAQTDRMAKRKAERKKEEEREKRKKSVKLDDIPTFLF